jgi:uncharacterized protein YjbI with pentapeptide repeats
MCTL